MRLTPLVMALALAGCASLTRTVTERDVSAAVGHPVTVEYGNADGWETRGGTVIIRLERGWQWEPHYYERGAVTCLAADAVDVPRKTAMERIGIPWRFEYGEWGDTKRDATRVQAYLERYLAHSYSYQDAAPGWPTRLR